jgi:hypothetical protein
MAAEVADDNASEEARRKIDAINEPVEWYFTLAAETPVATAPEKKRTKSMSALNPSCSPLLNPPLQQIILTRLS